MNVMDSIINCLIHLVEIGMASFIKLVTRTNVIKKALDLNMQSENDSTSFKNSLIDLFTCIKRFVLCIPF